MLLPEETHPFVSNGSLPAAGTNVVGHTGTAALGRAGDGSTGFQLSQTTARPTNTPFWGCLTTFPYGTAVMSQRGPTGQSETSFRTRFCLSSNAQNSWALPKQRTPLANQWASPRTPDFQYAQLLTCARQHETRGFPQCHTVPGLHRPVQAIGESAPPYDWGGAVPWG